MKASDNFVYDELGSILHETREQKCFDLGYSYAAYWFYTYFARTLGKDDAEKCFRFMSSGTDRTCEYFRIIKSKDEKIENNVKAE